MLLTPKQKKVMLTMTADTVITGKADWILRTENGHVTRLFRQDKATKKETDVHWKTINALLDKKMFVVKYVMPISDGVEYIFLKPKKEYIDKVTY